MTSSISNINGCIDGLNIGILSGWIYDSSFPDASLPFSVEVDGKTITNSVASCYRADLVEHGLGNGKHGFFINLKMTYEQLSGKIIRLLDKHQHPIPNLEYQVSKIEPLVSVSFIARQAHEFKFNVHCSADLAPTVLRFRYGEACIALKTITLTEGESELIINIPLDIIDGFSDFFGLELDGFPALLWLSHLTVNHLDGLSSNTGTIISNLFIDKFRQQALATQVQKNPDEKELHRALLAYQYLSGNKKIALNYPYKADNIDVSILFLLEADTSELFLMNTIASILLAYNKCTFEIILLLNKMQAEHISRNLLGSDLHYKVLLTDNIESHEQLFKQASLHTLGEYIVMVNSPIEVMSYWLDELIEPLSFNSSPDVTIAKEINCYGEVASQASFIDINGKAWETSQHIVHNHPSVNYKKEYNHAENALLWCAKTSFFDGDFRLSENSFLDIPVDIKALESFKEDALIVHYCPQAEVIINTVNLAVTTPLTSLVDVTKLNIKKKRILLVDHAIPVMGQDAGSYAAIQEIKLIQSLGYDVTFVDIKLSRQSQNTVYLQKLGVEVVYFPFYQSIESVFESYLNEMSAIYITRYHIAEKCLPILKRINSTIPILFNNADLHFLRELRMALNENDPQKIYHATITRDRELNVMRQVDAVLSYTETEYAVITSHLLESNKVHITPWVLEGKKGGNTFEKRKGIAFLGGYLHAPNVDAVTFFTEQVAPLLKLKAPEIIFYIYGSNMPNSFISMEADNIKVIGFVENLDDLYHQHRVFVAPLLSGAGIKGKVLESIAYGLPTVLSSVAAEGIGLSHNITTLQAESPEQWCEEIIRLYHDQQLWERISHNQKILAQTQFSFSAGKKKMRDILLSVGLK